MDCEANILGETGHAVLNWIAEYWRGMRNGPPEFAPDCLPGELLAKLPLEAPSEAESFEQIIRDLDESIIPKTLSWMHPQFHAYFPSANSAASLMGDMVSGAINAIGFSWVSNPAGTELEICVIEWLARMMNLPSCFCYNAKKGGGGGGGTSGGGGGGGSGGGGGGSGGGVIIGSASEAVLQALLAARERAIANRPTENPFSVMSRLVGYTSKEAHSSVRRAGLFARVPIRLVALDKTHAMDTSALGSLIAADLKAGLIPAFVCATLGTTGVCAVDDIPAIGGICRDADIWLHVDAAYGGNALICPEYQYMANGIELADSLVVSPHKWMMVNYDCSVLWVRNHKEFTVPFAVEPAYLQHAFGGGGMPDFRHWNIPCGRRFRALKLWFVLRMHGVRDLQDGIRSQIQLGREFAQLVASDGRFQLMSESLGVVGFRLKGANKLTEDLLARISSTRCLKMIHTKISGRYIIRFVASGTRSNAMDVQYAWSVILLCVKAADQENLMPPIIERPSLGLEPRKTRRNTWHCREKDDKIRESQDSSLPSALSLLTRIAVHLDTDD
ncbi:Aromatic-L-amino-acid decarboxylase [Hypsibius exemplaris]|uniref:Aromatic-L-amino-acid decarboxylase n=1 Tax=Hypsibius exemplaris TaxID=2072580 RepID=A0A1W0X3G6_HYPEX|nr:Aromatic-L-amino-acid decarboxylase [Hypsibius exemplaris]